LQNLLSKKSAFNPSNRGEIVGSHKTALLTLAFIFVFLTTSTVAFGQGQSGNYSFILKWGNLGREPGQLDNPFDVAVDGANNVYVTDTYNHRIQKFSSQAQYLTSWGGHGAGNGQFNYSMGVTVDKAGDVYVVDGGNARIQKFTTNGQFISSFGSKGSGDGEFNLPFDVALDSYGNIYVSDSANHRIQKFSSQGVFVSKWGTLGSGDGQLNYPHGIAVDAQNNIYVGDHNNHRIQKFSSNGTYLTQWGSEGTGNGQFSNTIGLAIDKLGNVYVADYYNDRIQEFTCNGEFIGKWGTKGEGNGEFNTPKGVAIDNSGYIYVADTSNSRIQKFEADASLVTTQSIWVPGVAKKDYFTYELYGVFTSNISNSSLVIPQFEQNNTVWLKIAITDISESEVYQVYTIHYRNGNESVFSTKVDLNPQNASSLSFSEKGVPLCAANLNVGDPFPTSPLFINQTVTRNYACGPRETNLIQWNYSGESGTLYFDRATGALIELHSTHTLVNNATGEIIHKTDVLTLVDTNKWQIEAPQLNLLYCAVTAAFSVTVLLWVIYTKRKLAK
jgi:sugar lactone lactonase YvrE